MRSSALIVDSAIARSLFQALALGLLLVGAPSYAGDPVPPDAAPPAPTDAPPAPAPAPPLEPATVAAPALPDAPMWFKAGGCDLAVAIPADGKIAEPATTGSCDWKGKGKATLPKGEPLPAAPCHVYFKSSGGFIMGELIADKACAYSYAAATRAFVRTHEWSDGMYHVAVSFAAP